VNDEELERDGRKGRRNQKGNGEIMEMLMA
jgi:hypothetical protein